MDISNLVVETFKETNPTLVTRIKQLVESGETRAHFIAYLRRKFPDTFKTSITVSASIATFDYYKHLESNPLTK